MEPRRIFQSCREKIAALARGTIAVAVRGGRVRMGPFRFDYSKAAQITRGRSQKRAKSHDAEERLHGDDMDRDRKRRCRTLDRRVAGGGGRTARSPPSARRRLLYRASL